MQIEDIVKFQLGNHLEIRNRTEVLREKFNKQEVGVNHISTYRYAIIGFSVAACLIFMLYLAPWGESAVSPLIDIERPTLADYRSASSSVEIDEAIANEEHERALEMIDETLALSVKNLVQSAKFDSAEDEVSLYERELEMSNNYQLRWMRIYVLVQLLRVDDAISDLEMFSTLEGSHQEEAKKLLVKLKSR